MTRYLILPISCCLTWMAWGRDVSVEAYRGTTPASIARTEGSSGLPFLPNSLNAQLRPNVMKYSIERVEPNREIDFKMAVVTPDPTIDYKIKSVTPMEMPNSPSSR